MGAQPLPQGSLAVGTVRRLRTIDAEISGFVNADGGFIMPIKATDGDPDDPVDGQMYLSLFNNNIRVYVNSGWRTVAFV